MACTYRKNREGEWVVVGPRTTVRPRRGLVVRLSDETGAAGVSPPPTTVAPHGTPFAG